MDLSTAVETRELLRTTWTKFDAEHDRIVSSSRETAMEQPYFKNNRYDATMLIYLAGMTLLNRRIEELSRQASQAMLQSQSRPRSILPNISLLKFSGAFSEWRPFEELFSSMVKDNPDLSQVEKMHYLRTSLEGEAAKVVANLKLSADSFAIAWNRLSARFDNKRLLILAHLDRLMALPRIKERSSGSLNKIINLVTSSLSALETLGCPVDQWDHILVNQVGLALDDRIREDWETRLGTSGEFPPLAKLMSHLISTAGALEHIETRRAYGEGKRTSQRPTSPPIRSYARALNVKAVASTPAKTTQTPAKTTQTPAKTSQTPGSSQLAVDKRPSENHPLPFINDLSNNCSYCSQRHYIAFCSQFKRLNQQKKVKVVAESRLCYNCLGRHNVRQCRSNRRCNECGDRHHTLIHHEKRMAATSRTSPPATRSSPPRSRSSSSLSETTRTSQRVSSSQSSPVSSDESPKKVRQKSSVRRSSHRRSSRPKSSSSTSGTSSPKHPSKPKAPAHDSSHKSSSSRTSPPKSLPTKKSSSQNSSKKASSE
ncbi:hypothetical protein M0804_015528 [Polistes exclamans]|nr:hypothetical protein M0804_015528 [Polistes exclamans]